MLWSESIFPLQLFTQPFQSLNPFSCSMVVAHLMLSSNLPSVNKADFLIRLKLNVNNNNVYYYSYIHIVCYICLQRNLCHNHRSSGCCWFETVHIVWRTNLLLLFVCHRHFPSRPSTPLREFTSEYMKLQMYILFIIRIVAYTIGNVWTLNVHALQFVCHLAIGQYFCFSHRCICIQCHNNSNNNNYYPQIISGSIKFWSHILALQRLIN